jgi:hypothetical protein
VGAVRVGDGFALGMRALALGRWHVGRGGLARACMTDSETAARKALVYLNEALAYFRNQGMDPWVLFTLVQQTKAYADPNQFDEAQACIDIVADGLKRFPILASYVHEVVGQVRTMWGDEKATESFQAALDAAEESGLLFRREMLMQYLSHPE